MHIRKHAHSRAYAGALQTCSLVLILPFLSLPDTSTHAPDEVQR
jgi:hypothetical protein